MARAYQIKRLAMTLTDVLIDELRNMYSAENQLVEALPKLGRGARNSQLESLFSDHLEETRGQVERLKSVFAILDAEPTGEHCYGMDAVIEEGANALEKKEEGASFDSGIIGAALRTEYYEIAGYTATIAMANALKMSEVVDLLKQNLVEEENAAKKVLAVGQAILTQSAGEPESRKVPKSGKEKNSDKKSKEDEGKAAPDLYKHIA